METQLPLLKKMADDKRVTDAVFLKTGEVLLVAPKAIRFNSGEATMLEKYGIDAEFLADKPLPQAFLDRYLSEEAQFDTILDVLGEKYRVAALKRMIETQVKRTELAARNRRIATARTTTELVEEGTVSLERIRAVHESRRYAEKIAKEEADYKELGEGERFRVRFQHWTTDPDDEEGQPVPSGQHPPREFDIVGRGTGRKRKHFYFYSNEPNFGKSHEMSRFVAEGYNAQFVRDAGNWSSVRSNAQFLIFEENEGERLLPLATLKALTSGKAEGASANVKSYGDSYEPRVDVQVIILSNKSLYELYREWDPQLQRRFLNPQTCKMLEERFHVHRLDGDEREDRLLALRPSAWSEEYGRHMKLIISKAFPLRSPLTIDGLQSVLNQVKKCRTVFQARWSGDELDGTKLDRQSFLCDIHLNEPTFRAQLHIIVEELLDSELRIKKLQKYGPGALAKLSARKRAAEEDDDEQPLLKRRKSEEEDIL